MGRNGNAMTPWREKNRVPCIGVAFLPDNLVLYSAWKK